MPAFLDDFSAFIKERRGYLKEKMVSGKFNPLREQFEKFFELLWIPINLKTSNGSMNHEILAVDSSVYRNLLSTGGIFYIVRSLAVHRKKYWKNWKPTSYTRRGVQPTSSYLLEAKWSCLNLK